MHFINEENILIPVSVNIMLPYLILGLALSSVMEEGVSGLAGIEFGDNFSQDYLTKQNGIAIARTKVTLKLKIL